MLRISAASPRGEAQRFFRGGAAGALTDRQAEKQLFCWVYCSGSFVSVNFDKIFSAVYLLAGLASFQGPGCDRVCARKR
ncbi:hypothetical protein EMIT0P258_80127 [Pseudomonas sp. IT-P258]